MDRLPRTLFDWDGEVGMMRQFARRSMVVGTAAAVAASAFALAGSSAVSPTAEAARRRALTVIDTVRMTLVRKNGNVVYQSGTATGTLPGRVSARFVTSLTRVSGTVTFYPYRGGSITMTALGYPRSLRRVTPLTGTLAVRRGTGKYSRVLGSGTFSGTANRRSWSVTVNARANLTY
jgi:hypothetical protein